jgi:hypothetical protein
MVVTGYMGPSPEQFNYLIEDVRRNGQRLDQVQASLEGLNSTLTTINNNLLMLTAFWMLKYTEERDEREEEAKEFQPTGNMTPSELIAQMKEDGKEKIPYLADIEKIKEMKAAMVTMANVLANVR